MAGFKVTVAGSSANLGPGFDCLAMALSTWLTIDVRPNGMNSIRTNNDEQLLGGANLVVEAMLTTASRFGGALPGCDLEIHSDVPVARGLGSSGAAIVGGILVAAELLGETISDAEVIEIGGNMEGHADNVSASLLGGVTTSLRTSGGYIARPLVARIPWSVVVFVPDVPAFTSQARGLLPRSVAHQDAAFNVGRVAMLASALQTGEGGLLREAMQDKLHQPYRADLFPFLVPTINAAIAAGADGACLSGAGPTVLALTPAGTEQAVAQAMTETCRAHRVAGSARVLEVPERGSHVARVG